ncbi:MAG: Lrp/AsnC family transcriptional regulator [Candidatus Freyrarchaeum guaymaensis]|nr:Lrp/AsnC family transcriptional regulator [Candidatus Freyarchaeota archaeon]MDO8090389.1 Lrp/AsnC family transcriptional regulator [Candidatus Sigynarchaeota archaeon]
MVKGETFNLTERQIQILRKLYENGRSMQVCSVYKTQSSLAKDMGITRQGLSNHLRKLRDNGFIRTGRGFIDLTSKALSALGESDIDAFVFMKVFPQKRVKAYEQIRKAGASRLFRVTGTVDIIAQVTQSKLDKFLKKVSEIDGVEETNAHIVLEIIT